MTGFPFAGPLPVEHQAALPKAADVVVIGGGIAGISTAWELAGKGLSVVVCEKGRVAAEQSGRNWGWIRVQGRDPAEIPLAIEARALWQRWSDRLGPDLRFRRVGVTYMARTEAEMVGYEDWLTKASAHDLDSRMITAAETERLIKAAPGTWIGGMHTASDCRAEPWVAVPMIARAVAQAGGVAIRESCAVRALDIEAGRVTGVITEHGRIKADAVVLCGGAWSSLFLRAQGVSLPQLAVLSSVSATVPLPDIAAGAAADEDFAIRRRADGGYTLAPGTPPVMFVGPDAFRHFGAYLTILKADWRRTKLRPAAPRGYPDSWTTPRRWSADQPGPFEAMRVLNPAPDMTAIEAARGSFARAFPALGKPELAACWAGMIDTMPDVVPVLDHIPALPGLVLGTGLSGHGFGIGPAVGRVLADLVTGNDPGHDLSRFRFGRFSDGSRVTPGPAL